MNKVLMHLNNKHVEDMTKLKDFVASLAGLDASEMSAKLEAFEPFLFTETDLQTKKRLKKVIGTDDMCEGIGIDGQTRCSRRKKEGESFCKTHLLYNTIETIQNNNDDGSLKINATLFAKKHAKQEDNVENTVIYQPKEKPEKKTKKQTKKELKELKKKMENADETQEQQQNQDGNVVKKTKQQKVKESKEAKEAKEAAAASPEAKEPKDSKKKLKKVDIWLQPINGIVYFIDAENNIYENDDVQKKKVNPKIVGQCRKTDNNEYELVQYKDITYIDV